VAVIVLTFGAGYLFFRVFRESTSYQTAPHMAELRSPAKAEEISAPKSQAVSSPKEKAAPPEQQTEATPRKPQKSKARLTPKITLPPPATEIALNREAAPQPPTALPVAAPGAGGAADKISVIATKGVDSRLAAEAASPGVAGMRLAAARAESEVSPQAVAQSTPEFTPRDAVLTLARVIPSGRDRLLAKKISDRTFYFHSGYWIDGQCTEQRSADYVDIETGSAEREQILQSFPEVEKIRPAVIFWHEKNCVLR
jgi:hypothetical protein